MISELYELSQNIPNYEKEAFYDILEDDISEAEYDRLRLDLLQKQTHPLMRIRNGETLKQSEINLAVLKATHE